ncbi:MAG: hypothetical protein WCF84_03070 [Anaerolineae bacterium]
MSNPDLDDTLAQELSRALTPVRPPAVFRDHLRHNLQLAGRQQVVRRRLPARRLTWTNWWMALALMGGSLAAGSILAYLIRSRFSKQPA